MVKDHDTCALGWATTHGQLGTLKKTIAIVRDIVARDTDNWKPSVVYPLLHIAAKNGHDHIVEYMLDDQKADINVKVPDLCACSWEFGANPTWDHGRYESELRGDWSPNLKARVESIH